MPPVRTLPHRGSGNEFPLAFQSLQKFHGMHSAETKPQFLGSEVPTSPIPAALCMETQVATKTPSPEEAGPGHAQGAPGHEQRWRQLFCLHFCSSHLHSCL